MQIHGPAKRQHDAHFPDYFWELFGTIFGGVQGSRRAYRGGHSGHVQHHPYRPATYPGKESLLVQHERSLESFPGKAELFFQTIHVRDPSTLNVQLLPWNSSWSYC